MDTTQKTREQAVRQPRQKNTPPSSAQQRNGASRTAQEQRAVAAKVRQPEEEVHRTAAPKQRKPAADATVRKKTASGAARPVKKKRAVAVKKKQETAKQKREARQAEKNDVPNRKRAYGNSKPKKKSAIATVSDSIKQTASKRKAKKAAKSGTKRSQQPTPAVIYTQPKPFNRNRLLVQLLTVTAIVLALVLGLSVFFKVEKITVTGADVYSDWLVQENSGISQGDNLLTFSHARAAALIQANLPYVKSVRFGIKLPDTVNIIIEEEDVVYSIKSQDGTTWLINSDGKVVEQAKSGSGANYTQILGVTLDNPVKNSLGVATEITPSETNAEGETVPTPVTVTGAQRLNAVLKILEALEANDIVGDAASVDVSRIEDIILWYGTRYQVNLGDSAQLDYKIACMSDVILQMSDYQSGILDISFTTWPDQVGYTPFS